MKQYIVSDPKILSGKPVIAGTRIPVSQVLFLLKEGYTLQAVHDEYPNVAVPTLQAVMDELAASVDTKKHGAPILQI